MASLSDTTDPTKPHQLIDDKMMFRCQAVPPASKARTDYKIIAILGSQGSGSSTLMNDIFGMEFSTHESPKGIHSSWSSDSNTLILDAQGYPGGSQTGPEKDIAQFITATADCILLNLKQDEVARLAHKPQYQTVMATTCRMALNRYDADDPQRKAISLLYVIRDCDGRIDLESATSTVTKGVISIWENIVKAAELPNALLKDYVHLRVINLPHRIRDLDEYQTRVVLLRERFKIGSLDSLVPDEARSDVPLGDVFDHMNSVWKTIRGNVNISSERRAFAEKRCPLFVDSARKIVIEAMPDVDVAPEEFKKSSAECQEAGLTHYDALAEAYDRDVVQSHRNKLGGAIDAELLNRYMVQVKGSHSLALTRFEERVTSLQRTIPRMPTATLFRKIDELKRDSLKTFKDRCEAAKMYSTWNHHEEEELLGLEIDRLIESVRAEQTSLFKPPPDLRNYLRSNASDLNKMTVQLAVDLLMLREMAGRMVVCTVGLGVMVTGAVGKMAAGVVLDTVSDSLKGARAVGNKVAAFFGL